TGAEGLLRYVALDQQGVPATVGTEFPFAGQTFAFVEEATGVDSASLARVGCAGAFPLLSSPEEAAGPFTTLYLRAGDRLFTYRPTEGVSGTPGVAGTPLGSPAVAEAPTETATPTQVPTEAAVPTETATATPVPTETPTATAVPSETPTATPVPTQV